MANYFDRQRFLSILKDPAVVETLYKMYLTLGGGQTVSSNLVQINNRVTTIESKDYDDDIAAINAEVTALSEAFSAYLAEQEEEELQAEEVEPVAFSPVMLLAYIKRLEMRINELEDSNEHDYIPGLV